MIHISMEILKLPIMGLQERIQQELQENPVLEVLLETPNDELASDEGLSETSEDSRDTNDPVAELIVDANGGHIDEDSDKSHYFRQPSRPQSLADYLRFDGDMRHDFEQNMPSQPQSPQDTAKNMFYVMPDMVVERTETGDYSLRPLDDWVPSIYISQRYIELYKDRRTNPKDCEYLKRQLQAAKWLIESIEQRRHTLEKVASAIFQQQRKFLHQGPEHIEPLNMQQIADLVDVPVTTVSMAVDGKWVKTPHGTFPLKRFFA